MNTVIRGVVLRTLLVGLKGFTGSLPIPNLTFCSDFGGSAQSRGFLHSDLVEESRHLAFYNAGMPNIRIVTSVIGRAQRSIGRASALPGLYKTTLVTVMTPNEMGASREHMTRLDVQA